MNGPENPAGSSLPQVLEGLYWQLPPQLFPALFLPPPLLVAVVPLAVVVTLVKILITIKARSNVATNGIDALLTC